MKRLALIACLSIAACAAQPRYPPTSFGGIAPQGCMYPAFSLTYVCPEIDQQRKEAAEAAQQEQQKQALIARIGLPAYQQQQRESAAAEHVQRWKTLYAACEQQMPVPSTEYQDKWIQKRCGDYADSLWR